MIFIPAYPSTHNVDSITLLGRLERYAVFDVRTLASEAGLAPPSARLRALRLERKGLILRVARNTYTVHHDPLVLASRMAWPSYISLWYALSHHGMTLQVPQTIEVLTTRQMFRKRVEVRGVRICFSKISSRYMFGYGKSLIDDIEVFIATPEKALLDGLLLKRIPASELFEMMASRGDALEVPLMLDYVRAAGSGATAKRMGFMLERLGHDVHSQLEDMVYPTVTVLDLTLPSNGRKDSRWHLIDNLSVEP
jgi:predicted transcriptional regulator of viral defense system